MLDLCTPTFEKLAHSMGFSCETAGGPVEFRNPFGLENGTMAVLELTIVVGSVLALVYAIRRYRRHADPTNLVLWFGAIAYLLIIEPPIYFPGLFGIEEHFDTMFAHNLFSVEFLWGRLPLYIIAIYPLMATMAFEVVRSLGVFRRYGTVIGAITVGFVHHAFYEIFDQLGPQLRWWEWAPDHPMSQPFFDSVPLSSVVVFAALWPTSLAFCVQFFVGRHVDAGRTFTGPQLVWRTVVIGLLASLGTGILPLPATITSAITGSVTATGIVYALELVVVAAIAVPALVLQWRRLRRDPDAGPRYENPLMMGYAAVYLSVLTVLWLTALPDYFGAVDGRTAAGDPIGNLGYSLLCLVIATLCLAAVRSTRPRAGTTTPVPVTAGG